MAAAAPAAQDPAPPLRVVDTYAILGMKKPSVTAALRERGQDTTGDLRVLRARLIEVMHGVATLSVAPTSAGSSAAPAPTHTHDHGGHGHGHSHRQGHSHGHSHGDGAASAGSGAESPAATSGGGKVEEGVTATSAGPAPPGRHFPDSTILERVAAGSVGGTAVDGKAALVGWLPGPHYTPPGKEWKLQYRGSRHGWKNFHSKCDDVGPTVVLVLGERSGAEFVAGGYAAGSWKAPRNHGHSGHAADPDAAIAQGRRSFLFSLVDSKGHGPVQVPLNQRGGKGTRTCAGGRGPIFGVGEFEVGAYRRPLNEEGGSSAGMPSPCIYDYTAARAQGCTTFAGPVTAKFTTKELEVFSLQ